MKLKNFKSYSNYYSKDPKNFEKKIVLASNEGNSILFENITTLDEVLNIDRDTPVIIWENFSFSNNLHESFCSTVYNQSTLPTREDIQKKFKGESFLPNRVSNRELVKKMKFPIIGVIDGQEEEFKTYNKFKKSETFFNYFKEKLVPVSRIEVLVSNDEPLHAHKKINNTPFDINLSRWKYLDQVEEMCKKINLEYGPQYYIINLLESNNKLFLESITRNTKLTPTQSTKLYESAYLNYYASQLPSWFKQKIFEDHIKPYYIKKYYDSLLLKPTGTIDYSKYLDK